MKIKIPNPLNRTCSLKKEKKKKIKECYCKETNENQILHNTPIFD